MNQHARDQKDTISSCGRHISYGRNPKWDNTVVKKKKKKKRASLWACSSPAFPPPFQYFLFLSVLFLLFCLLLLPFFLSTQTAEVVLLSHYVSLNSSSFLFISITPLRAYSKFEAVTPTDIIYGGVATFCTDGHLPHEELAIKKEKKKKKKEEEEERKQKKKKK